MRYVFIHSHEVVKNPHHQKYTSLTNVMMFQQIKQNQHRVWHQLLGKGIECWNYIIYIRYLLQQIFQICYRYTSSLIISLMSSPLGYIRCRLHRVWWPNWMYTNRTDNIVLDETSPRSKRCRSDVFKNTTTLVISGVPIIILKDVLKNTHVQSFESSVDYKKN